MTAIYCSAFSHSYLHLLRPWTTWTPLAIVLGVSLIKEAIEDYKRNKADNEINNRMVEVLNAQTRQFEQRRWKDLQPGEIVMVKKDEFFPADLLFLSSETEEGTCYVETMNLDGETNLKIKKAPDGKLLRVDVASQACMVLSEHECERMVPWLVPCRSSPAGFLSFVMEVRCTCTYGSLHVDASRRNARNVGHLDVHGCVHGRWSARLIHTQPTLAGQLLNCSLLLSAHCL